MMIEQNNKDYINQTEKMLRRSEAITEAASNFADMFIWTFDTETDSVHCYKNLREQFGLSEFIDNYPESILELGFILPEFEQTYRDNVKKIKDGEKQVEFDCKIYYVDRTEHWIRFRFNTVILDERDKPLTICTAQPIDTEKALEARVNLELQKPFIHQENLMSYVVTNLTKGVILYHKKTRDNAPIVSEGMEYGMAAHKASQSVIENDAKEYFLRLHNAPYLINSYEHGETKFEMEFLRRMTDGIILWVRNTLDVLQDPSSGDIFLYEYSYDIDAERKRKQAIDSLISEEYEFIAIVNLATHKGRVIKAMEMYQLEEYMQEYDHDVAYTKLVASNVVEEDKERCLRFLDLDYMRQMLNQVNSINVTYRRPSEDGNIRRKMTWVSYLDERKEDVVIVRRDITDLYEEEQRQKKALEIAMKEATAASRAKSNFLAQMSHEIRTPMNAIMGMTKLAEGSIDIEEISGYLREIDTSSNYLLGLLNDVLDMSRIEEGTMALQQEWVYAEDILNSCINMIRPIAEAKNISFVYPRFKHVKGLQYWVDPLRTKQIMMNLLNNSVKFTNEGGTISLNIKNISHDESTSVDKVVISDTGCGMSKEFMTRMFKPFEQERNEFSDITRGTGLGLAIVKKILEAMDGSIDVESEKGEGTAITFTFTHKYRFVNEEEGNSEKPGDEITFEGKTILLVDDQPLNREIARKLLESRNAVVEQAADGKEAVVRFNGSKPGHYDAILMDIRMPNMDGWEATKQIRDLDRVDASEIPIIAMTANAFEEDMQKSMEVGMNAHLAKPINPELLFKTLDEHMKDSM